MKRTEFMLHSYYENLHEQRQLGSAGGTIIGKSIDDGGAGEPCFKSRVPLGVEMTPLEFNERNKRTRLALFRLENYNEKLYLAVRMTYQIKTDGSKRTPEQCYTMLDISRRAYFYNKANGLKWLKNYFELTSSPP